MMMLKLILALSLISLSIGQDCPLPNNTDIESPQVLTALLVREGGEGSDESYDPNVIGSIQYVCLAQGNMIDTYKTVSVIATFTPNPGESSRTNIFQLRCESNVWVADTNGELAPPDSSVINAPTRTDCSQCRHNWGHDRCRSCDTDCNTGLMRCTGLSSSDCCLTFTSSGQCSNAPNCSSSGANFIANEDNGYFCSCVEGYTGSNCSINIDDCDPNPCENGANCTDKVADYSCLCLDGYTGKNCSTDINNCDPNPCENGAICRNEVADYSCLCLDGYTGKNCSTDINDCDPNPCENGASCGDEVADYFCYCLDGYTGKNCSTDINNCNPNPCENGASCGDEVADYSCLCLDGYTGKNCSTDINNCDPNPCENGASCTDKVADYSCLCLDGYTGKNCSTDINNCDPNPCENGASCRDKVADYSCHCLDGYTGKNCSTDINNCDPNPCENGGICTDNVADYSCACKGSWTGKNCSVCLLENCLNCSSTVNGCHTCIEGYLLGDNAICIRDDCISPCLHEDDYHFRLCQYYCSLRRWRQTAIDHGLTNVPNIKGRNMQLSPEDQWREALQEQRNFQNYWLQEAQKRGLRVTGREALNSDDLQSNWYDSFRDNINDQKVWQAGAMSLKTLANSGDFNDINTEQPTGGADADELHSTYEEYITNWHDDLTAYDEEFNNN